MIEVVRSIDELRSQIHRFAQEGPGQGEALIQKVRAVRLWVYDQRSGSFAPARFCGYRDLSVRDYVSRFGVEAGSRRVRGDESRDAVRGLLGRESADDLVESELGAWIGQRFMPESASRMHRIRRVFLVSR